MSRPNFSKPTVLDKRYEMLLLFDVHHGNPNGDPDAENAPRIDPETGVGLVTDVAIKRKIRNYVGLTRGFEPPNNIYVKERGILANEQRSAYRALGIEPDGKSVDIARAWMCKHYFDIRTFGAVMTTGKAEMESDAAINSGKKTRGQTKLWNCGQVRGPVQFGFATSIDPITSIAHTITRVALTNPGDAGGEIVVDEHGEEKAASGQMGRKFGVAYALYRMHGFVSPFLAKETLFTRRDMATLLNALTNLFDHDRSANRGEMSVQRLWLFEHKDELGNAPAHRVLETVRVPSVPGARSFAEYETGIVEPQDGTEVFPGVTAWRYV
ncbi:type I-C CRISPR-associated protein Cas7/Csd2 [Terriglobus albidus]|uniref:type I-C CRISPR-associated protein Cas7/Csd2 n=1 Tax=Terriglobus albidus TaxID=1592106 RepID=UPI0021E09E40|nr:type I-C CRISPR-associated protein Cas7/Csd2 [Terriglobus albidus]